MRAWRPLEGDGDRGGAYVMVPAQAADDGLAGDGAVLVVVAQLGVEVDREPVLGVLGQQSQDHLQAAPPGAQQRGSRVRVDAAGV